MELEGNKALQLKLRSKLLELQLFDHAQHRINGLVKRSFKNYTAILKKSLPTVTRHLGKARGSGVDHVDPFETDDVVNIQAFLVSKIAAMKWAQNVTVKIGQKDEAPSDKIARVEKLSEAVTTYEECAVIAAKLLQELEVSPIDPPPNTPSRIEAGSIPFKHQFQDPGHNALIAAAFLLGRRRELVDLICTQRNHKLVDKACERMADWCSDASDWLAMFCATLEFAKDQSKAGRECNAVFRSTAHLTIPSDNEDVSDVRLLRVARSQKGERADARGVASLRKSDKDQFLVTSLLQHSDDFFRVGLGKAHDPANDKRPTLVKCTIAHAFRFEGLHAPHNAPHLLLSVDVIVPRQLWDKPKARNLLDNLGWETMIGNEKEPLFRATTRIGTRFGSWLGDVANPLLEKLESTLG